MSAQAARFWPEHAGRVEPTRLPLCEAAPHDRTEDSSAQRPANLTAAGFKGRPHTRTLEDPLQMGFSRNLRPWQLNGG